MLPCIFASKKPVICCDVFKKKSVHVCKILFENCDVVIGQPFQVLITMWNCQICSFIFYGKTCKIKNYCFHELLPYHGGNVCVPP